jgi:hypothetical protein
MCSWFSFAAFGSGRVRRHARYEVHSFASDTRPNTSSLSPA